MSRTLGHLLLGGDGQMALSMQEKRCLVRELASRYRRSHLAICAGGTFSRGSLGGDLLSLLEHSARAGSAKAGAWPYQPHSNTWGEMKIGQSTAFRVQGL
jgi:hypothetical protein